MNICEIFMWHVHMPIAYQRIFTIQSVVRYPVEANHIDKSSSFCWIEMVQPSLCARSRSDKKPIELLRLRSHHIRIPKLYFSPKLYYSKEDRNGIPEHSKSILHAIYCNNILSPIFHIYFSHTTFILWNDFYPKKWYFSYRVGQ